MIHIVLHEPEIPANTGNIGRTCVATNSSLHLIEPLGFHLTEKNIKRAGMDYWDRLQVERYADYEDFLTRNGLVEYLTEDEKNLKIKEKSDERPKLWFATTKAQKTYTDVSFGPDDYIMFGKESAGIPEEILVKHPQNCIRIPMWGDIRSLNLSNSVAIVLYEALRQNGFEEMQKTGQLHHLHW